MINQALGNVIQSIFEQAYSLSAMPEHVYRSDVVVDIDSNEVASGACNHVDGE